MLAAGTALATLEDRSVVWYMSRRAVVTAIHQQRQQHYSKHLAGSGLLVDWAELGRLVFLSDSTGLVADSTSAVVPPSNCLETACPVQQRIHSMGWTDRAARVQRNLPQMLRYDL